MSNDKLDEKLQRIAEHLGAIDVTLAKQQVSLDHHVKRTDLLEAQVKPVFAGITALNGAVRFVKFIGVLALIAEAVHVVLR